MFGSHQFELQCNANIILQHIDENVMYFICITNNYKMLSYINMTKKYLG